MKLKKKEDQSMATSLPIRMGNKIPMAGVTETKFGTKMEGSTIQSLRSDQVQNGALRDSSVASTFTSGITSWLLWTLLLLTSNRRLSVTVFALQRGWGCVRV